MFVRRKQWRLASALALVAALAACEASDGGGAAGDTDTAGSCGADGETACLGDDFVVCENGEWVVDETCAGDTPYCDPELGCLVCIPGETYCEGSAVMLCDGDGQGGSVQQECDSTETCVDGACSSSCAEAAQSKSYLGCKFLAVSTSNAILDAAFNDDFAVIIGNPDDDTAVEVTVSRGGAVVTTETVAPASSAAIALPMVMELKGADETTLVAGGAYEIESNLPVIAYQYNPLNFTLGSAYSYTNDASLLLPEHTLTGEYMASTWPTWGRGTWQIVMSTLTGEWSSWYPGFMTVAATTDGTEVTVTAGTYTQAGAIEALAPGETATVTLDRGDVLQVYSHRPFGGGQEQISFCADMGWPAAPDSESVCPPENMLQTCDMFCSVTDGDLTGTTVSASAPLAVFAGHMCTFMPFNEWACDHLEEMMFPLESWGTELVMTAPAHPDGVGVVPTMYRVLARNNGTEVAFTPAVHAPVALDAGQFLQFETDQDFVVEATKQIYVTQTMMGQNYFVDSDAGDPAMGSGIPLFQARGAYSFLTPSQYTSNFLNVVAPSGAEVLVDEALVTGWQEIGSTGFAVARVQLAPGAHRARSVGDVGFGITSYGYASYTSYLYPGGMNVDSFIE